MGPFGVGARIGEAPGRGPPGGGGGGTPPGMPGEKAAGGKGNGGLGVEDGELLESLSTSISPGLPTEVCLALLTELRREGGGETDLCLSPLGLRGLAVRFSGSSCREESFSLSFSISWSFSWFSSSSSAPGLKSLLAFEATASTGEGEAGLLTGLGLHDPSLIGSSFLSSASSSFFDRISFGLASSSSLDIPSVGSGGGELERDLDSTSPGLLLPPPGTSSLRRGSVGRENLEARALMELMEGEVETEGSGGRGKRGIPASGGIPDRGPPAVEERPGSPGRPPPGRPPPGRPVVGGRLGSCNPGGMTGVMPAMGLFTSGMGSPFFSASSICCSRGG